MRLIVVLIGIAIVVFGIHLYVESLDSYYDKKPVKQSELNFDDLTSEDLYKPCVTQGNQSLKQHIDNGVLAKKHYAKLLKQLKQSCHCYATDKALIDIKEKYDSGQVTQATYHQSMSNQLRKCMKPIRLE